jgi:hypothetical protein
METLFLALLADVPRELSLVDKLCMGGKTSE